MSAKLQVALLRGGAWIEIQAIQSPMRQRLVALLRGGAWIEILSPDSVANELAVALLRGGAWIEITIVATVGCTPLGRTPSRGCVD